ncbi:branched-chain amino acid ABC transporter, ATP binding protein [Aeropyrum pernix K1]|uniref:Branched-chain amino acid ABC transporter, ATP binding protein n=2 Tax=Aeropyrum pernix TaxID=56636 RepID=Q9Y8V8_AERPE|nr:branched-chain amino acid ABC transporter, ATP binding protein [Aeropyrum pernix K1]
MMAEPLLEVKSIDVYYGEFQALFGVSLRVYKGEIVALLGGNGAGKTTTLLTISGLLKPRNGSIIWQGRDITGLPAFKRVEEGISHVPEGRGIFPRLTVYENLRVAASTRRAKEHFQDSLEQVYTIFPILKARRSQLAGTLSGGEQQMLAIARALIQRPILLMMDEPSLGLAPKLARDVIYLASRLREELGVTILLVEQNVGLSLKVADRGYVMETGRIVLEGASDELALDPRIKAAYLGL